MRYFVVMIDFGRKGREAIVDPEITARGVVSRIESGEYPRDRINFIHCVEDNICADVTEEMLNAASQQEAV